MERPDRVGPRARRLVRNVITAGGSQAGVLAVSLLVTPVLVTGLGLERYGLWALAGVLANYIGLLDLGIGNSFVRFLAFHHAREDRGRYNSVVRLGLLFYGAFGAVVLPVVVAVRGPLVAALSVPLSLRGEAEFLLVGATGIFLTRSLFVVFRSVIASVERIDVNNRIALIVAVPNGLGAILAVTLGFGLRGLVVNGLITAGVTVVAQIVAAYRLVPTLRLLPPRIEWSVAPELARYGLRIQATRIAELLNGHVDKIVLGFLIGTASVGFYDLGLKLSLLVAAFPTLLLPAVLPTSTLLESKGDRSMLIALHQRAAKYVGLVLAPVAAFVFVTAPALLRLWIGPEDLTASVAAARLLVVGSAPLLALGVARLVARGIGLPQMEMRASLIMAAVNLALSIVLVQRLGPLGAPLGSACAGLIGGVVFLSLFRREMACRYDLDPIRPLLAPLAWAGLAGAAAAGALWATRWIDLPPGRIGAGMQAALAAVPFAAVYLAGVLRTPLLDEYDQRVARETWAMARAFGRRGAGQ